MHEAVDTVVLTSTVVAMGILSLIAIWSNWLWIAPDGFSYTRELTPGFFEFWCSHLPRRIVGMPTRMDERIHSFRE